MLEDAKQFGTFPALYKSERATPQGSAAWHPFQAVEQQPGRLEWQAQISGCLALAGQASFPGPLRLARSALARRNWK